jgi:hypothetical protein
MPKPAAATAVLELRDVTKAFGSVVDTDARRDVT